MNFTVYSRWSKLKNLQFWPIGQDFIYFQNQRTAISQTFDNRDRFSVHCSKFGAFSETASILYQFFYFLENNHISANWPRIKDIKVLCFLKLSKLEKRRCPQNLDFRPISWDMDVFMYLPFKIQKTAISQTLFHPEEWPSFLPFFWCIVV